MSRESERGRLRFLGGEHLGIEAQPDELTHLLEDGPWLMHQRLVAEFEVTTRAELPTEPPNPSDGAGPGPGGHGIVLRAEASVRVSQCGVPAVTDEVEEPCFREQRSEDREPDDVTSVLVAVPALAPPFGVQTIEPADGVSVGDGFDTRNLPAEVVAVHAPPLSECLGRRVSQEVVHPGIEVEAFRARPAVSQSPHFGDEVGLERHRQLRVGVEHETEDGRARTLAAHDDGKGRFAHNRRKS